MDIYTGTTSTKKPLACMAGHCFVWLTNPEQNGESSYAKCVKLVKYLTEVRRLYYGPRRLDPDLTTNSADSSLDPELEASAWAWLRDPSGSLSSLNCRCPSSPALNSMYYLVHGNKTSSRNMHQNSPPTQGTTRKYKCYKICSILVFLLMEGNVGRKKWGIC
ncbi:hypothetical protein EDB19DRAFT_2025834 [Suillus lakei]|nr:hypothetical protein EDB19DRAFT_2025834 [Suillus lakei]